MSTQIRGCLRAKLASIAVVALIAQLVPSDRVIAYEPGDEIMSATIVKKHDERQAIMQSQYAAPLVRVFDALTKPEQLKEWLGSDRHKLVDCIIDLRAGGSFTYVFRDSEGREFTVLGRYLEVMAPSRIVHEESYVGYSWDPLVVTTELFEESGRTTMRVTTSYPSTELRDVDFPNLQQAVSAYTRLAAYLDRN